METTVINATEYRNVSLALLSESKTNPRRIFEDAALKELAESIRTQGVLSPLLVRPLTENGFEIVAGTIANATGIRVLKAIADAVPVRLMRRDLLFVLMQTSPPPVSHCENRALPLGIVPEKCSFSTHISFNGS
jgi:ParB-like nuclease domain